MEEKFFDKLAMTLAAPLSRRRMLKAAIASAVGGVFVGRGFGRSDTAFASIEICTPMGGPCGASNKCPNGICHPCCGGICRFGTCVCPPGQQLCQTENALYTGSGICSICCPVGLTCDDGVCVCPHTLEPPCGSDTSGNPLCCSSAQNCVQLSSGDHACVCPNSGIACSDGRCCPHGTVCCGSSCCNPNCVCGQPVLDEPAKTVCATPSTNCTGKPCHLTDTCPAGQVCVRAAGCNSMGGVCKKPCNPQSV